jgi:glycosyltransferase involved in cell wall biosynthesis
MTIDNTNKQLRICVITYPRSSASITPLLNLVKILSVLTQSLYLITGNEGRNVLNLQKNISGYAIQYKKRAFIPLRLIEHAILQLKITIKILQINNNVDLFIFYMGEALALPMLACKCTGKPVMVSLAGSFAQISKNDKDILSNLFVTLENLNYLMADNIVIYSQKLVTEWGLQKYTKKIVIAHEQFIDFNQFKPINNKNNDVVIGFVGRLSEEKGILNFIQSIPFILQKREDVHFLIGGDGHLKATLDKYLHENNLSDKVELCGWINHDELIKYFNKIHLLVLPSYTEGLPNIMLEAMACGVPLLATRVGAITDVIIDNETGFLMENNSPECIAKNVFRVLDNPLTDRIAQNAINHVQREFTFAKAIEAYHKMLRT